MSKKTKPVSQDDFEAELQSTPQVFSGMAVSILPKEGGGFNLVKITLDTKSLEVGEVTDLDTADNKPEAIEKFKIQVVRHGII